MTDLTQCFAQVVYEGNGATHSYSIPFPYLNRDHIHVLSNGTELAVDDDYEFTSDSVVNLFVTPISGTSTIIARVTPRDDLIDRLTAPSTVSANELNLIFTQLLYLVQEALCPPLDDWVVDYFITMYGSRNFQDGDVLGPVPLSRPVHIASSMEASYAKALVPPTDRAHVFYIMKKHLNADPVNVGSLSIAQTTGVGTWTVPDSIDLVAGDMLYLQTHTVGADIDQVGATIRAARTDIV